MDNLFIFLLAFKDELMNVLEVFNIIKQGFEIYSRVLFQGSQRFYVSILEGFFRNWHKAAIFLDLYYLLQKVYFYPSKHVVQHAQP